MATLHKITARSDGRIGLWISPKVELEIDHLEHLRAWTQSHPESLDDAALKEMVASLTANAKNISELLTDKPVEVDAKRVIQDAVDAAKVAVSEGVENG